MKMSLVILAVAGLSFSALPGCFVADELAQSDQLMQQHSRSAAAVAAGPPQAGLVEKAQVVALDVAIWWQELGTTPAPPDDIVRCEFPERTGFTMESDCVAKGGRVLI